MYFDYINKYDIMLVVKQILQLEIDVKFVNMVLP